MNSPELALSANDLRVVDAGQLAALNALYSSAATHCGDQEWRWQYTPRQAVDHWARLECGEQQLWLAITAATVAENIDFSWRDFDGDARLLAWCASFASLVQLAAQVFQNDWAPAEICDHIDNATGRIDAGFMVYRGGRCEAVGHCIFAPETLPAPVAIAGDVPSAALQRLPIAIPIEVDRAVFTHRELRELEIGAVIRIQQRAFLDIGATLRLTAGRNELLVRVTGTRLTVVSAESIATNEALHPERKMKSNDIANSGAGDNDTGGNALPGIPIDIENMPVEVRFEAGRLLTRYDELCRVKPGYTYELGHTLAEHTIDITANGALIARGELVRVDDQVGVRITALARDLRAAG